MDASRLILGDCLEVLADLPEASVDALVTDPPFGIGFDYSGEKEIARTPAAYWEWFRPRYEAALRCVKPGGFVAVWQAQLYFRHFWEWFGHDIHIYCGAKNFVQIRKIGINYAYDPIVMFYKPGASPLRPAKPANNRDFFVANTAPSAGRGKPERGHPCPRPLDQVRVIVANFTQPNGTVLDPFLGSGTTGVACAMEGRQCIGVERNADYLSIAHQRMAAIEVPAQLSIA